MRTNIDLDDKLLKEAFRYSRARTKKELVHEAIAEYVASRKRRDLRDLKGTISFAPGYDHKALRQGT